MDVFVSVAEERRRLGVSARTLRRWEARGLLVAVRGPGGRRRFSTDSLARLAGVRNGGRRAAVYARVSSIKQKRDGNLKRQRDRLVEAARAQGYRVIDVIAEQASGINERRRGLRRLLEMGRVGKIDVVFVEFKDRLARFGYSYIETFLTSYGVRVVCLEEAPGVSSKEELTKDLITIITVFSARLYGRRSHGVRKKVTDVIRTHHAQSEGRDAAGG